MIAFQGTSVSHFEPLKQDGYHPVPASFAYAQARTVLLIHHINKMHPQRIQALLLLLVSNLWFKTRAIVTMLILCDKARVQLVFEPAIRADSTGRLCCPVDRT